MFSDWNYNMKTIQLDSVFQSQPGLTKVTEASKRETQNLTNQTNPNQNNPKHNKISSKRKAPSQQVVMTCSTHKILLLLFLNAVIES